MSTPPLDIILIEDEADYASLLAYCLKKHGHPPTRIFNTGADALSNLTTEPDLLLLDVMLPDANGLDLLSTFHKRFPNLPIVIVSSQTSVDTALHALEKGAFDYLTKGYDDLKKLPLLVSRISERNALLDEAVALRDQSPDANFTSMVGTSEAMLQVYRLVRKTLRSDLAVALIGESGTGKEVVANTIHHHSARRLAPFIVVNCAAIPTNLMESTFFGHERGSFTGADTQKIGAFEQSHQGTLFLDEIGDLDHALQAKLLRVLQNGTFQRVGGNELIEVDVRVLCATNKDIPAMVHAGEFREDLYYRLFQFPITLPPLRERDNDILLLANHFREAFLQRNSDVPHRAFSAETKRLLLDFKWPGNVRQLKSVVERALLLADEKDITPDDLLLDNERTLAQLHEDPTPFEEEQQTPSISAVPQSPVLAIQRAQTPDAILPWETIKRMTIAHAFELCDRHMQRTAGYLGVTRSTISRLLKQYDLL